MRVMLVDAFDSFVYVIEHYYSTVGAETRVVRINDDPISHYRQWQPQLVVLGPGPGTPEDHGYQQIISAMDEQQAIFGVCLGHQALGEYFGWKLTRAPTTQHGKYAQVHHDGRGVFQDVPSAVTVVRYHSLAITDPGALSPLVATAYSDDGVNMAARHRTRPIESVQFHPESIGIAPVLHIRTYTPRVTPRVERSREKP